MHKSPTTPATSPSIANHVLYLILVALIATLAITAMVQMANTLKREQGQEERVFLEQGIAGKYTTVSRMTNPSFALSLQEPVPATEALYAPMDTHRGVLCTLGEHPEGWWIRTLSRQSNPKLSGRVSTHAVTPEDPGMVRAFCSAIQKIR